LVIVTLVFLIGEMAMWPLVYVKMVFHKLTMVWVYSKSFRVSRADKFTHFLFFTALGPIIIIGNTMVDTFYFVRHLVQLDLQKVKHKTRQKLLKKSTIRMLMGYFEENQERIVTYQSTAETMRENMDIKSLI
jgi:hypothetical protein